MALTANGDTGPFIQTAQNYQIKCDYDGSGNLIYMGWAVPGTATYENRWRLMAQFFNTSNKLTSVLWPNNSTGFAFSWDSRSTYRYSITVITGNEIVIQGLKSPYLITQGYS